MLYYLLYPLRGIIPIRYITFRVTAAAITSFLIGMILAPLLIKAFKRDKIVENVAKTDSPDVAQKHVPKSGTPTMGGLIISGAILFSTILWGHGNAYMYIGLLVLAYLTILGFVDDYIKLRWAHSKGVRISTKLVFQFVLGAIVGVMLFSELPGIDSSQPLIKSMVIPFFSAPVPISYASFLVLSILVIMGTSNAVNLTDGLDGLAITCSIMAVIVFMVVSYVCGRVDYSAYLDIPFVSGAGELSVLCACLAGAGLAFLWYNCFPAQIFMGDTGSLPIGGLIGYVAIVCRHELLLLIVGGIFVIEALSVILQVFSFRLTGKRIFLNSPLHHHYEKKGLPETKITIRFCIVAAILAVFSVATLRLR